MIYSNDDPMAIWQWKLQGRIITVIMTHMTEKRYVLYAVLLNRNITISMMMKNVSAAVNVSESRTLCIDEKSILNEKEGD